jgi:hypothetical protein
MGTTVTMSIMTAMVALYAGTDNKAGNSIAILCLFVFVTFYGLCIDNTAFVYCAEIFPTTYRAKGVGIGLFVYYASSIAFLTPAPTAMANIGWKFYLVFVCCSFVAYILTYFFVPEVRLPCNNGLPELMIGRPPNCLSKRSTRFLVTGLLSTLQTRRRRRRCKIKKRWRRML